VSRPLFSLVAVIAVLCSTASVAQPEPSPLLTDLLAEDTAIRAESEELGRDGSTTQALANVEAEITGLRQLIYNFEQISDQVRISQEDLLKMREDAAAMKTEPGGSEDQKRRRKAFEAVAKRFLGAAAKRVANVIGYVADATEELALRHIRRQNMTALLEHIRAGRLQQQDVNAILIAAYQGIVAAQNNRERLVELHRRRLELQGEISVERKRLVEAAMQLTDKANLIRDEDKLGDAFVAMELATGLTVEATDWFFTAINAQENRIYYCPRFRNETSPDIEGTFRYADWSQLCFSAVHAGAITLGGGYVRVRLYPAVDDFSLVASTRNGIKSGDYHGGRPSFSFTPVIQ
jgi:hypothetical protein